MASDPSHARRRPQRRNTVSLQPTGSLKGSHVHVMGAGGIGMSAIAQLALAQGATVSGCDLRANAQTERLQRLGAAIHLGHDPDHITPETDLVVFSSAIRADNPELLHCRNTGVTALSRLDFLAQLMDGHEVIGVTGTHGKTTTTWLAAHLLITAGLDPTAMIGGVVASPILAGNVRLGSGPHFVAEIDESDGRMTAIHPHFSILLNIEREHLDHYGSLKKIRDTFAAYAAGTHPEGLLIACADDPHVMNVVTAAARRHVTFGFGPRAHVRASDVVPGPCRMSFTARGPDFVYENLQLEMPGRHNVLNALAVVVLSRALKLPEQVLRQSLASCPRVGRRFEIKWELGDIQCVDDYAHHPSEVRATLEAARAQPDASGRIVAVFQPHRYSRTARLMPEFATAFDAADQLIITPIYAADEAPIAGVSGKSLAAAIAKRGSVDVTYIRGRESIIRHLAAELQPGDVVITMGAGDIGSLGDALHERLETMRQAG